jgi:hypothetical protein
VIARDDGLRHHILDRRSGLHGLGGGDDIVGWIEANGLGHVVVALICIDAVGVASPEKTILFSGHKLASGELVSGVIKCGAPAT